jgi:hypothetical protein
MDLTLVDFGTTHFGGANLGDPRNNARLILIGDRIAQPPKGSLPDKMQNPAELEGLYRLMNRPQVTHEAVLAPHYRRTHQRIAEHPGDVCLVHDTTEINLTGKRSLHRDVGQLGNGKGSRGYLCHNSIAVTAQGQPLGLANQILHVRGRRRKTETRAQRRDCPQRESRLWKRGRQAIGSFPAGQRVIDLCDRGGDGFEFLDYEHEQKNLYVVRSLSNRRCQLGHDPEGPSLKLHDHLRTLPAMATRPLDVRPQPAHGGRPAQPGRTTLVAVAWAAVTLRPPPPGQARGEHRQEPLPVWGLRVWEPKPPDQVEAVEWLLLSNVTVAGVTDAWERVDWYQLRWPTAEEFHKAQTTGCDIEGPQFTTAAAMKPMIGLLSVVAWLLLYLRWASRNETTATQPAREHVPWAWVQWLSRWRCGAEQVDWTVREFFLALARLGGHQNRTGDGLPGWQTLWKGWMKLRTVVEFASLHSG